VATSGPWLLRHQSDRRPCRHAWIGERSGRDYVMDLGCRRVAVPGAAVLQVLSATATLVHAYQEPP
jgi:hypothetical protein